MAAERPSPLLPDAIGPYVLRRVLGSGATARVFEAERRELGKRVALKLLEPRTSADANEEPALDF